MQKYAWTLAVLIPSSLLSQHSDDYGLYIYVFLYPSPDIHRQWLISASSTRNGFRWTRLISSSSDVIFTKLPWSDGSLSSARRDSIRLLFTLQTLYTSAFTHLKKEKGCWGVNNPMKPGCSLWSHFPVWIKDKVLGCFDCLVMFHLLLNHCACLCVCTSVLD